MAGLVTTFGSGAMTNSIGEIDNAGTIFVIGSNTTAAHPMIGHRMRRASQNGATLIVVNPKEIDLVKAADYFVQPKPGSDTAFLMGMCRYIIENDLHDKKFIEKSTEDFEVFEKSLEEFTPAIVEEITGVPWEQFLRVRSAGSFTSRSCFASTYLRNSYSFLLVMKVSLQHLSRKLITN